MKKTLSVVLIGLSLSGTAAFAGLQLVSKVSTIDAKNTTVQCTVNGHQGSKIPAIFNQNVGWSFVKLVFLQGQTKGNCVFTYTPTNTTIGSGEIDISSDLKTATVANVTSGSDYTVSVSGSGTENVNITLAGK